MKTKDEVKKSWLAQTLFLNVRDVPKAQSGQIVPLALACPFGTSETPYTGVCAILDWYGRELKLTVESCFLGEQSQNVYENKG